MDDTRSTTISLGFVVVSYQIAFAAAITLNTLAAVAGGLEAPRDVVRYVIDQEDGSPVPGAIVIATWRSTSRAGHQICNRVESYVSDANGSFNTPPDSTQGVVTLGAYKKGYQWGNSPRGIQMASDGDYRHAQVVHYRWNEANNRAEVVLIEPKIYSDRASAIAASRERIDTFLRKSRNDRDARLFELHRVRIQGLCEGGARTTRGAKPFLDAILQEQSELNDASAQLDFTQKLRDLASTPSR